MYSCFYYFLFFTHTCKFQILIYIYIFVVCLFVCYFFKKLRHEGPVWQVAWAHPKFGKILASASYDRKVIVWKEVGNNSWSIIHQYAGHELSVNSISWAPHEFGLSLACASSDGSVTIHNYNSKYYKL